MRPRLILAVLMSLLAAPLMAQSPPADTPSPKAAQVLAEWHAFYAGKKAEFAASPAKSIADELNRRIVLDQGVRQYFGYPSLSADEQRELMRHIGPDSVIIDVDDTAYVKTILPPDGWFRNSRDGEGVGHNAWLIVQHSPDRAFQKQVLAAMEPLVKQGEAAGPDYALLYDRTEMFEGRPQRYGSQGICKDGKVVIAPLEDAVHVDDLRHAIGLTESFADYQVRLGIGRIC
jgi:hypothetical protein